MKLNILITGGAGFVGSNLALYLNDHLKDRRIICFDNLIRRGSEINAARLQDHGITFVRGDIRHSLELLKLKDIETIIDCSAEPSVLAAYQDPVYTIDTNLMGTVNCLELARREKAGLIFLSTSRVYPIEKLEELPFEELPTRFDWKKNFSAEGASYAGIDPHFPLSGVRSLYGASKLSSELICLEYFNMFSIRGVINRIGDIAGPWQMGKIDQGIVGFWLARHKYQGSLSYIGYGGEGKQVRDAVHIDDICELILYQATHLHSLKSKIYNVGGGRHNSFSLLELTQRIQEITHIKLDINSIKENRKSDIRIYMTDNIYVQQDTGWRPKKNLDDIIIDTNAWIDKYLNQLQAILN